VCVTAGPIIKLCAAECAEHNYFSEKTVLDTRCCVYSCRTYDKSVGGGGRGTVKDMYYEVRRAEACVD
jgi:hypothetical protein